jgi:hypothetical protein
LLCKADDTLLTGAAVFLGFLWLLLMRLFAGVLVWLTIICVYIAFYALTAFVYFEGIVLRPFAAQ